MFIKGDLVYLVYVDDTILAGPNMTTSIKKYKGWEEALIIRFTHFNCGIKGR